MSRATNLNAAATAIGVLTILSGAAAWQWGSPGVWSPVAITHIAVGVLFAISLAVLWWTAPSSIAQTAVIAWISAIAGVASILYIQKYTAALHAWLGLAALASLAAATIPHPRGDPRIELVDDRAWPSLRGIAAVLLAAEILQVTAGVAFRHGVFPNIVPHAVGAVFVGFLLTFAIIVVLQRPHDANVHRAVLWTIGIAVVQIMTGVFVFFARMQQVNMNQPPGWIDKLVAVIHVTNAGLTFAATTVLVTVIFRSLNPALLRQPHPRST